MNIINLQSADDLGELIDAFESACAVLQIKNRKLPSNDEIDDALETLRSKILLPELTLNGVDLSNLRLAIGGLILGQVLITRSNKTTFTNPLIPDEFNPLLLYVALYLDKTVNCLIVNPTDLDQDAVRRHLRAATALKSLSRQEPKAGSAVNSHEPKPLPTVLAGTRDLFSDSVVQRFDGAHKVACNASEFAASIERLNPEHWLTIVVPCLREDLAERVMPSIDCQTQLGVTVIFLNADGNILRMSEHGTAEKIDSHITKLFIPTHDSGPYDAMNFGLLLSITPWIYFMGSDDELASPSTLSEIKRAIDDSVTDEKVIYGNVEMRGEGHGTYDQQIYGYEFDYDRLKSQTPCHQSIFYRTSALKQIGGFDLTYRVCADWHANLRLWWQAKPLFIDVVVAKFARGGISSTQYDSVFF